MSSENNPFTVVFTAEQGEDITKLASMGWLVKQIAIYLDIPYLELQNQFDDKDSEFRKLYDRGVVMSRAIVDISLSNSAQSGNLTAIQMVAKRNKEQYIKNLKHELFGI